MIQLQLRTPTTRILHDSGLCCYRESNANVLVLLCRDIPQPATRDEISIETLPCRRELDGLEDFSLDTAQDSKFKHTRLPYG